MFRLRLACDEYKRDPAGKSENLRIALSGARNVASVDDIRATLRSKGISIRDARMVYNGQEKLT